MAQRVHAIENKGDFKVIVAIDFGTHGTGIGYAIIDQDEKEPATYIEQDWCKNADNKNKTDILLDYNGKFLEFGEKALERYINYGDDSDTDDDKDSEGDGADQDEESDSDDDEEKENLKPMLFESFKMALYREEGQFAGDGDIKDVLTAKDGRTVKTSIVFTSALEYMRKHIFNTFHKKKVKVRDTESEQMRYIQGIEDVQWILTVPAIWSDRAKAKMERWAEKAELIQPKIVNHLRIVYEPDCASISCQYEAADEEKEMNQGNNSRMKPHAAPSAFSPGTRYVLIDAGGGTVDIACHQVLAEMEMEEVHRPTGGPWGSDKIDERFDLLLDEVFGNGTMRVVRESVPSCHTKVIDGFRKSKMQFCNNPGAQKHKVQLNSEFIDEIAQMSSNALAKGTDAIVDATDQFREMLEDATPFGLDKGHLKLENDTLWMSREIWTKHLFDSIIDPMIEHVENLIADVNQVPGKDGVVKEIKYLCIAGGLSSSKYFQYRVKEAFGVDSKYGLAIRIPRRPILSVIDGALKLGLKPNYIQSRRVKYTYGIAVDRSEKNVDGQRLPEDYLERNNGYNLYVHPQTKRRTVRNLFSAFIKKNEPIELDAPIEKEYRRFHKDEESSRIALFFSDEDDPYVIEEKQQPLASVKITFPEEYDGLKFIVQFFFGDTKLRAKVNYRSQRGGDSEQVFPLENLELDYQGLKL